MRKIFFILSFALLLISCNRGDGGNKKYIKIENIVELKIVDSIRVNYPNVIFQDYSNNKLLLFNMISSDIVIHNAETDSSFVFNKVGESNEEYKRVSPETLRFLNDSVIGVGMLDKIKKYDLNGNFLDNINVDNNDTYAPLKNFGIINNDIVSVISFQGNPSSIEFYKKNHKLFLKKNLKSNMQERFAIYPDVESDLSNEEYYYSYVFDFFPVYDFDNEVVSFVNSNDANLYSYDIKSMKKMKSMKLDLENYNPILTEFNRAPKNNQEQIYNLYSNGVIRGYFKNGKREIIEYNQGLKKRDVIDFFKTHTFQFDSPDQLFWLNIMDNGNKIVNDVKVNDSLGKLAFMLSQDTLVFYKPKNKLDESKNLTTFYYVKIIEHQ